MPPKRSSAGAGWLARHKAGKWTGMGYGYEISLWRGAVAEWLERSSLVLKVSGSKDSLSTEFFKNSPRSTNSKWVSGSL